MFHVKLPKEMLSKSSVLVLVAMLTGCYSVSRNPPPRPLAESDTAAAEPAKPKILYRDAVALNQVVDFRRFTVRGFLYSSDPFAGEFESIGMVTSIQVPKAHTGSFARPGKRQSGSWIVDESDVSQLLDDLYLYATGLGADAVVSLVIAPYVDDRYPAGYGAIQANGLAIKRNQP